MERSSFLGQIQNVVAMQARKKVNVKSWTLESITTRYDKTSEANKARFYGELLI
ncbi:MAG: hypothetical protein JWO48_3675 [Bryobacterales bacterium]|nr:hypothetical protein [Bryobacterales bacterium]